MRLIHSTKAVALILGTFAAAHVQACGVEKRGSVFVEPPRGAVLKEAKVAGVEIIDARPGVPAGGVEPLPSHSWSGEGADRLCPLTDETRTFATQHANMIAPAGRVSVRIRVHLEDGMVGFHSSVSSITAAGTARVRLEILHASTGDVLFNERETTSGDASAMGLDDDSPQWMCQHTVLGALDRLLSRASHSQALIARLAQIQD